MPPPSPWRGKKLLITSGPTREYLDAVRFMTNASSGRMGWALAREGLRRGARVVVVSGPVGTPAPEGARVVPVASAVEMRREVLRRARRADAIIAAAAVSDWRFERAFKTKISRTAKPLRLTMIPNPDIIGEIGRRPGRRPALAGFALETERGLGRAEAKRRRKGLDLIVANGPRTLGGGRIKAVILTRDAEPRRLGSVSKAAAARAILKEMERFL